MANSIDKLVLQITEEWSEDIHFVKKWDRSWAVYRCIIRNRWITDSLFSFGNSTNYEDAYKEALAFYEEHSWMFRDWIIAAEAKHR